jgi:hypothetical protein
MHNPDVTALIEDFAKQIIAITEASAADRARVALATAFGGPLQRGPGRTPKQAVAVEKPTVGRRRMTITPKVARARKLQGQYLGALRALGASDRAKVKAIAKQEGVAAAVKLALSLKAAKKQEG